METAGNLRIGAYFYPITQSCEVREVRAEQFGVKPGEDSLRVPNELTLASNAQPLFDGHDQPRVYCIPDFERETLTTQWDDADPKIFATQAILARDYGLSYFIFNSYRGLQHGQPSHEFAKVTHTTKHTLRILARFGLKYARMETLEKPRAILPIPTQNREEYFFVEPDRQYDVSPEAAHHLVDSNIYDWRNPSYLHVGGLRPYVPILMPNIPMEQRQDNMKPFIHEVLNYAFHKYDVIPYIVGVMRQSDDLEHWMATEVDAITNYLDLPRTPTNSMTEDQVLPVQHYNDLMDAREKEWETMIQGEGVVIPSVPVGWDASPRGEQGYRLEQVSGLHPYTPLVVGSTAVRFAQGLQTVVNLTQNFIPEHEQFVTIWAWNEVSEGGALLPRIINNTTDTSYLEAIRTITETLPHTS